MSTPTTPRRRWFKFLIGVLIFALGCGRAPQKPPQKAADPPYVASPEEIKKAIEYVDGTRSGHQIVNLTLISIKLLGDQGPSANEALPALEKFVRGETKYPPDKDEKAAAEEAIAKIKGLKPIGNTAIRHN